MDSPKESNNLVANSQDKKGSAMTDGGVLSKR